jgi:starvation-inducible DNA-binding protein
MTSIASTQTTSALRSNVRELAPTLQGVLADLIDLSLLGKHAHWNVEGLTFQPLHRHLDELVDDWRRLADDVAERAAAIGFSPDGRVEALIRADNPDALPAGKLLARLVIERLSDRVAVAIDRARTAMGEAAVRDAVTEDLLIGVVATLEKHHWMLRAHRAN